MKAKNFEEIGKALVAFHVGRASWASRPETSYENDVESFKMLVERCYNDYYGAGKFWLKNTTEDDELMEDKDWTLTDCNGNVCLEGRDEIEAMTGTLEIDGDYDTWYVQRLEDCSEDELKLIYEDGYHHTLSDEDLLAYCCYGLDKKMIDSVDYGKEACTVHFTDGTNGTIEFKRDEDICDTIDDFFSENDIDDKSREKFFDDIEAEYEDLFKRFTLYRTANDPQVWECTDKDNGIVCRFRWHQFNETQQVKVTDEQSEPDAMAMARAMREMGDWLAENHKDVVF